MSEPAIVLDKNKCDKKYPLSRNGLGCSVGCHRSRALAPFFHRITNRNAPAYRSGLRNQDEVLKVEVDGVLCSALEMTQEEIEAILKAFSDDPSRRTLGLVNFSK